jgi:23S rRNA A1618 N6-methylase RlmF
MANYELSLKPNGQVDFSDPKSMMQLTKALLKVDFNLEIDLPDNRLCPPVSFFSFPARLELT